MITITLLTASGAENLGDELITLCEIKSLREEFSGVRIILFSHDPDRSWRFFRSQLLAPENLLILPYFPTHIRTKPLKNIFYLWQTVYWFFVSSNIYIGGGGLLYGASEEGHSPLRLWAMRAKLGKILRKPVTYLSLWVSALESELRPHAKNLFKNTNITVRDVRSLQRVQSFGYEAILLPDPVFHFTSNRKRKQHKKWEKVIGFVLRSGYIPDESIEKTLRGLLKMNYTIFLLPHSLHPSDIYAHDGYYLQKFLYPGVHITQTIEQTLDTYHQCDLIVGMRLHSSILSLTMKIPLIAISYSSKTESILSEKWYPFIQAEKVTPTLLITKIQEILPI